MALPQNEYANYNAVSSGEVCSISMAKQLGIFDATRYYREGADYARIKTYDTAKDSKEGRTDSLCTVSQDQTAAYGACLLTPEAGVGFVRKAGSPDTCVTVECPKQFTKEPRGMCAKPLEDAIVSKLSRCDERWYDWFTVPNYHLGNKYQSDGDASGKCYAPCDVGNVPFFAKDPVDGSTVDFSSKDDPTKCISRAKYFGGKYIEGSEYCPVAWIKRMSLSKKDAKDTMEQLVQDVVTAGSAQNTSVAAELQTNIPVRAEALYASVNTSFEDVAAPNAAMHAACKTLHTEERLREAHDVCTAVNEDEAAFADKLRENGDDEARQKQKIAVIKHACNGLFCNEKVDPYVAESIGREPICFKNIGNVDMRVAAEKEPGPPPTADGGKDAFRKSLGWAIRLFVLVVFGTLLYFFMFDFFWPKMLRPILRFVWALLTGWSSSKLVDAQESLLNDVVTRK